MGRPPGKWSYNSTARSSNSPWLPSDRRCQPSWLQQLGKWSYNPMLKSATARQLYMTYILHIQDLIEDGLYIFTDLTIYIIWKIQVRYLDMMLVMITGGEYCIFHWKIRSQVSQTRRTTTRHDCLLRTRMRTGIGGPESVAAPQQQQQRDNFDLWQQMKLHSYIRF